MKIISIGFKNPFHDSGYTNTIKINNLEDINVLIGKNNSGKTNVLRSIYNLLHQDIDRSNIFRRLKVKLNYKDFEVIIEKFHEKLIKIYQNRRIKITPKTSRTEQRLKSTLNDGSLIESLSSLFGLMKDYPIPNTFSLIFNFNNDLPNSKLLFNYNFNDVNNLNEQIHSLIENILKKVSLDEDLIKILIKHILPFNKVILIPSFRTLEGSEKNYQDRDIREINTSIATILDKSFNRLPIDIHWSEPFKIPNLALMLNFIRQEQISNEYRELVNREFFESFISSIRKIFPDLDLSINFQINELTTDGGYKEYGRDMGDWTKLGHGTQELISLLFLLILPRDCVYIIDEPESGLHSGLQLKVLNFIKEVVLSNKRYSKQFILATHSTSFIDFTSDYSHYICKKSKHLFAIEILQKEKLYILRSELGLTLGALLQSNGIIWVEGPSDMFYVKTLFQCFGIDLDANNILIRPYFGKNNILGGKKKPPHITPSFLQSLNPNFLVIMDSDKKGFKMQSPQRRIKIKKDFEAEGYTFWIIDNYCDIEGLLPQNVLDNYFSITQEEGKEINKKPFEKLEDYITSLRNSGLIEQNDLFYDKTRDAPKISHSILLNKEYSEEIQNNSYLRDKIVELSGSMLNWSGQLVFEDGSILQQLYPQDAPQDLKLQRGKIVKDFFTEFTGFEAELSTLLIQQVGEQEKYSDDFEGILFYLIDEGVIAEGDYQTFLEIRERQHDIFLRGIVPSFDQLKQDTLFLKALEEDVLKFYHDYHNALDALDDGKIG